MLKIFQAKDRTEEILERYLDGDFSCSAALDEAPSRAQLKALAKRYGCHFPEEFLAHSTGEHGGIYIEVKEDVWPRPKRNEVGPFWAFLYGLFIYGLTPRIPEWMNIDLCARKFREETGHVAIPCLQVLTDADIYLFEPSGKIVRYRHETDEMEPFDGGFFDLLAQEVSELRKRKDQKRAESRASS